jgi:tetratricopeptide (TPR) repeat protein
MFNRILWTLDNEIEPTRFERLCTDLLNREGYKDIVPVGGTHDHGRDAEIKHWVGTKLTGGITFFQYSLEKKWESKLKRELNKVRSYGHKIDFYVFVSSQEITGDKRDKLANSVASEYGWQLIVFDREWFRLCLEERHPDLATKYLGIQETYTPSASIIKPILPDSMVGGVAWQLYAQGHYEAAALALQELLKEGNQNIAIWQALSWCQYSLFRYDEALMNIERALSISSIDEVSLSLKASILTEDGIRRGDRASVMLGRNIFKRISESSSHWVNHYNYGNALHALGDYEAAKTQFLLSLHLDPSQAIVWKNLGTVYYHLGNHNEELRCYDKALSIDDSLSEALSSKAVTLLIVFKKAQEAIHLISRAIEIDSSIPRHWPKAWYWLGQAYFELGNYEEALRQIEIGLTYVPSNSGFLDLKARILAKLWRESVQHQEQALAFFQFRLELSPSDYDSFVEIAQIYNAIGQESRAWDAIAERVKLSPSEFSAFRTLTLHTLEEYLAGLRYFDLYKGFREHNPISEHTRFLLLQQIVADDDFEVAFFLAAAVPFGLGCELLARLPENKRKKVLPKLHNLILDTLEVSIPRLATKLLRAINHETMEQKVDGFSRVLVACPWLALVEFSRQAGWIGSIFKIPIQEADKAIQIKGKRLGKWQAKIAGDSLIEINKVLKIFKEE